VRALEITIQEIARIVSDVGEARSSAAVIFRSCRSALEIATITQRTGSTRLRARTRTRQPSSANIAIGRPYYFGYHCTPVNSSAFGATGGDGIHLSLLKASRATVPSCGQRPRETTPTLSLPRPFNDFLRLGSSADGDGLRSLDTSPLPLHCKASMLRTRRKYTEGLRLPDPTEWAQKHGV
jgi:hypothetical protein